MTFNQKKKINDEETYWTLVQPLKLFKKLRILGRYIYMIASCSYDQQIRIV